MTLFPKARLPRPRSGPGPAGRCVSVVNLVLKEMNRNAKKAGSFLTLPFATSKCIQIQGFLNVISVHRREHWVGAQKRSNCTQKGIRSVSSSAFEGRLSIAHRQRVQARSLHPLLQKDPLV